MATDKGAQSWPSVAWDEREWRPRAGSGTVSQRERATQTGTYRAAVPARIAELEPRLENATVLAVELATAVISRLDTTSAHALIPYAPILLRSESASSSQIERLTASPRALAEAELGLRTKGNAPQIVANTRAMERALALGTTTSEGLLEMHRILLGDSDPEHAGRWREEQVWIGGSDFGPLGALFVPPHHEHVPAAMGDLIAFAGRMDMPVLVQAAIVHAQFETIHPFTDGNGRTGRALLHAMLQQKGLVASSVVPISSGLLRDVNAYFSALDAYRLGEIDPIVTQISQAAGRGAENAVQLLKDLEEVRQAWKGSLAMRRDAAGWQIVDLLPRYPVFDTEWLAAQIGATAAKNPRRTLDPLIEAGILIESLAEGRRKMWRAPAVLDALTAFADRAGRRRTFVDPGGPA